MNNNIKVDSKNNELRKEEIEDTVNKLIEKIKSLQNGTETSIYELLSDNPYTDIELTNEDLLYIFDEVIKKIELENIFLDFNKYKDQIVGLPFNIPFIKKSKKERI